MASHSSTLAWRIPWTQGPGGLQSVGQECSASLLRGEPEQRAPVSQLTHQASQLGNRKHREPPGAGRGEGAERPLGGTSVEGSLVDRRLRGQPQGEQPASQVQGYRSKTVKPGASGEDLQGQRDSGTAQALAA